MGFVKNIEGIRARARQQIEQGAVTQDYQLDREQATKILNEALATELVCVLRYKFHYFMASGIHSQAIKEEFKEHAAEEQEHADRIAERIKQLGGKPEMNPAVLTRMSHSDVRLDTEHIRNSGPSPKSNQRASGKSQTFRTSGGTAAGSAKYLGRNE